MKCFKSKVQTIGTVKLLLHLGFCFIVAEFSILSSGCGRQEHQRPQAIGIGLLSVNTHDPIPFYHNESDLTAFDTLKFETDRAGRTSFISRLKLRPFIMTEGDSDAEGATHINMGLIRFGPELKFCVIDSSASSFKIITDQISGETAVIKKNPAAVYHAEERMIAENNCSNCPGSKYNPHWYIFETWQRYLQRVEFITQDSLVIYDGPNGKVVVRDTSKAFLPFSVSRVEGDWLKVVKGFGRESNFEGRKKYEGWIKWRDR